MADGIWKRNEIASPCNRICVIHPDAQICVGCFRTMEEIAGWSQLAPEERRALMEELPTRAGRLRKRRGGRNGRRPPAESRDP